jgi:hypothetical protein
VVLEPSPYFTIYWHSDLAEQPLKTARPKPRQAAELQEKAKYVADLAGSNTASFWGWHGGTGHGRHCSHETSLPVSMSTVWVTAGVPRPTVTTYSMLLRGVPSLVGTVTSPSFEAAALPFKSLRMLAVRRWCPRSTSAVDGSLSESEEGNGEHGL